MSELWIPLSLLFLTVGVGSCTYLEKKGIDDVYRAETERIMIEKGCKNAK